MNKSKNSNNHFFLKVLSLFSVIRGYNVITLVIAEYLAAIFVFSAGLTLREVLLDHNLFLVVLASVCVVSSGYIINDFYDAEKDKINKPIKSEIDRIVSQKTKLQIYFLLNFVGTLFVFLVSWKAALFFSGYIFLIWFYSHKLKKYPIIGLLSVSILTLLPFFAIFIYYKNFSGIIFVHGLFLFLLIFIRELMKNLENIKGDILTGKITVPIRYGEKLTKLLCVLSLLLMLAPIRILLNYPEIGLMKYYFYAALFLLIIFLIILLQSSSEKHYRLLHNLLKILIFVGVFSLMLIDQSVIIGRIL